MQVSGIANNNGTIGTYSYDAWGNPIGTNAAGSAYHDNYYNQPWEYMADYYGGVKREYADFADPLAKIYWSFVRYYSSKTPF